MHHHRLHRLSAIITLLLSACGGATDQGNTLGLPSQDQAMILCAEENPPCNDQPKRNLRLGPWQTGASWSTP
jgi:uncharacterized lipoprotein YmbA